MFFIKFLKKKPETTYPIEIIKNPYKYSHDKELMLQINQIDLKIKNTSIEIFKAQLVRIRSLFSGKSNIFIDIQRKYLEGSAISSANWHQQQLIELYKKRKSLQIQLNRRKRKGWGNIYGIIVKACILSSIASIFILLLLSLIYSLPILIGLIIIYLIRERVK